jgi:AcrR family transcriptional regulator
VTAAADRSLLTAHPGLAAVRAGTLSPARARLLDAMARVSAERGYLAATVADVVRAAGVSRSTFYEEFASKEELFVEALRHGVEVLDARVEAAVREQPDWRSKLRAGIRAYLSALEEDPRFARASLIEVHVAGPAAMAARTEALHRFAERYRRSARAAREERPEGREPPAETLLILCAGTEQLIVGRLRAQPSPELTDLEDVFCDCAESLLLGPIPTKEH